MTFDDIIQRLQNRIWSPMSDLEAMDMVVEAYMNENITEDEKEMLLNLI